MGELLVDWSTTDPDLTRILEQAASYPEYSVERMAAEGALHTFMAEYYQRKIGEHLGWQRAEEVSRGRRQKARSDGG